MNSKYFNTIDEDTYRELYEDWMWLLVDKCSTPLYISKFGDLVFEGRDQQIYLLDVVGAKISIICNSKSELISLLDDRDWQDKIFLASLVDQLEAIGKVPSQNEIYDFTSPPHLGGHTDVENIQTNDRSVAISILGQIQEQTHHLPVGTKIEQLGIINALQSRI
jgi:hypothetical protein